MKKLLITLVLITLKLLIVMPSIAVAEKYTFGVTIPLTGDFASYGQAIREGLELAKKEQINGPQIELIYEDACLPAQAVAALRKLQNIDKIDAIVANFCVIGMTAMAPELEKHKIPTLQTAAASDSVINSGSFIFTTNIVVRDEARQLADYASEILGARSASVLYLTTDFGIDYNKYFGEQFEERGGKVISSDSTPIGVNDFRTELLRIKNKKPDVIFAATSGASLGVLIKQAREIGLTQPILSPYEAEDPSVLENARQTAEGLVFFSPVSKIETSQSENFKKRFELEYQHSPSILSSNAYDGYMLLSSAVQKCSRQADCIRDYLQQVKDYDGVSGQFTINKDGGTTRDLVRMTVKDGKFQRANDKDGKIIDR